MHASACIPQFAHSITSSLREHDGVAPSFGRPSFSVIYRPRDRVNEYIVCWIRLSGNHIKWLEGQCWIRRTHGFVTDILRLYGRRPGSVTRRFGHEGRWTLSSESVAEACNALAPTRMGIRCSGNASLRLDKFKNQGAGRVQR